MSSPEIISRPTALERLHYFSGQLITANDLTVEQDYFLWKLHRHNRLLHGWGIACGCAVKANPVSGKPWQVRVCSGYAITPPGDEIYIGEPVDFDLAGDSRQPQCACPGTSVSTAQLATSSDRQQPVYLGVCYTECQMRPVSVQPLGCACDEACCEYSRVRESFELVRLSQCPKSYRPNTQADICTAVPTCPPCLDDACVVLATIKLPASRATPITQDSITLGCKPIPVQVTNFSAGLSLGAAGSVVVTFSKSLDATTINTDTFKVQEHSSGSAILGTVNYEDRLQQATFTPSNFFRRATYDVTLRGTGPSPIRDIDGLALDGAATGKPGSDYTNQFTSS